MLSTEELKFFRNNGYVLRDVRFDEVDVEMLRAETDKEFRRVAPSTVMEKDGRTVRGVHGSHLVNDAFARLLRQPWLLEPAQQVLGGPVYVHQFKINAKRAMVGDVWPWHQDFIFWNRSDGMRAPRAVNVAVLLDDATEINGPLLVVPGSHRVGVIDVERRLGGDSAEWQNHLSSDLDYTIDAPLLAELSTERGIHPITGAAGSVVLFDPLIVHGSGSNMAPRDRRMVLITYNHVDNALDEVDSPRPEFLAARDHAPVVPLDQR